MVERRLPFCSTDLPLGDVVREIIGSVRKGVKPVRSLALIVLAAALGSHAQTTVQSNAQGSVPAGPQAVAALTGGTEPVHAGLKLSPDMIRRIEVMIRNRAQVSLDYGITIGEPTQSELPGYDQIIVTLTANGAPGKPLPFLLSSDGKTLAQFNKFDLSQDPKEMVSGADRPARGGPSDAPVLIVGFDDLECPFCAQMNALIFPAILDHYKDQVRVVYRDLPLEEIHPWAMHAAVDANCLGALTTMGYWNFVDYVHAHAGEVAGTDQTTETGQTSATDQAEKYSKMLVKANQSLDKIALDEGARQKVDAVQLAACVQKQDDTKMKASVQFAESDPLRINQTPVLFINGEKVEGVVPIQTIYRMIDGALIAAGKTPPPSPAAPPVAAAAQPAQPGPSADKRGSQ